MCIRDRLAEGLPTDGFVFDTALAAYLLDATAGNYDLSLIHIYRDYRPELYDWFRRLGFLKLSEKWGLQPADGDVYKRQVRALVRAGLRRL